MRIKYFYPNEEDKIVFTREELEKLLNDTYEEGRKDGSVTYVEKEYHPYPYSYPIIYNTQSPTIDTTPYVYCTDTNSIGTTTLETVKGIIGNYQGEQINVIGNNY